MSWLGDMIGGLVSPITSILTKKEDRKQAHQAANAALAQARQQQTTDVILKDQELEHILAGGLGASWKDEYAVILMTLPYIGVFVGALLDSFGHPQFAQGMVAGWQALDAMGVEVGFLMKAAVLSALGLSIWRKV